MIKKVKYATASNGDIIHIYTITNKKGEYVSLLDYGASIHEFCVYDNKGKLCDIVLGCNKQNVENSKIIGGVVGRVSNRIENGKFNIDNKEYYLEKNNKEHFLHGAKDNYATKMFKAKQLNNSIVFYLLDKDSVGFECDVDVVITYEFDDDSCLKSTYELTPKGDTLLNPSSHVFFNLNVNKTDARNHNLQIFTDKIPCRNMNNIPKDGYEDCLDQFCFLEKRNILDVMNKNNIQSYDQFYDYNNLEMKEMAMLESENTGIKMTVKSDMPCLIFFLTKMKNDEIGKKDILYKNYSGLCLETSFVPNAINCNDYIKPIYRKGEKLVSKTEYHIERRI